MDDLKEPPDLKNANFSINEGKAEVLYDFNL